MKDLKVGDKVKFKTLTTTKTGTVKSIWKNGKGADINVNGYIYMASNEDIALIK